MKRTRKAKSYKRIDFDITVGETTIQCVDYLFPMLRAYSDKLHHSSTRVTPNGARKKQQQNRFFEQKKTKLESNAKRDRTYPELNVGDEAKVVIQKEKMFKNGYRSLQRIGMK